MTSRDAIYWGGFIAGSIIGILGARALGVTHNLLQLLCGIAVGVGVGFITEQLLAPKKVKPMQDDSPDRLDH